MTRHGVTILATILALLVCLLTTAPANAQEADLSASGRALFRTNCSACHGESAKGDGNVAEYLNVKPADLTRLTMKNGGEFPTEEIYKTIDGRESVKTHGSREMPIWGKAFQLVREEDRKADFDPEEVAKRRIDALVAYLKTIQEKG